MYSDLGAFCFATKQASVAVFASRLLSRDESRIASKHQMNAANNSERWPVLSVASELGRLKHRTGKCRTSFERL